MIRFKDLTTIDEFAGVVELERTIWGPGYADVVPLSILAVSVMRGGILIGAFAETEMIGFVYSLPAIRDGKPTQWSHMLGVLDRHRKEGIGERLKLLQRDRALELGADLIEWTFDPMQAVNAHLNFRKLGVEVGEYEENVYGQSTSPLHRGNPTDRFVAEWWIRRGPRVHDTTGAVPVNRVVPRPATLRSGEGSAAPPGDRSTGPPVAACADIDLDCDAASLAVVIPTGFTEMMAAEPSLALEWRLATRRIFKTYFARGYRAVDFRLDRVAATAVPAAGPTRGSRARDSKAAAALGWQTGTYVLTRAAN